MDEARCQWLIIDGEPLFVPGCYSAALGNPEDCVCSLDEDELWIGIRRAQRVLLRAAHVPGAPESLAVIAGRRGRVRIGRLLQPLRARLTRAREHHADALRRWRASWTDRIGRGPFEAAAYNRTVAPWWRDCTRIERLIQRLQERAQLDTGTVAEITRKHPQRPSAEVLKLLAQERAWENEPDPPPPPKRRRSPR